MAKNFDNVELKKKQNPIEATILNSVAADPKEEQPKQEITISPSANYSYKPLTTYTMVFDDPHLYYDLQALAKLKNKSVKDELASIIKDHVIKAKKDEETANGIEELSKMLAEIGSLKTTIKQPKRRVKKQ